MKSLRALRCHDPRDRVYALMSICGDAKRLDIVADYSPSNTVYNLSLSLTQQLMDANINMLIDVSLSRRPNATISTPSWALPLIYEDDYSPPTTFDEVFYPHPNRTWMSPPHFDMESEPPVLTIKGRILDTASMILKRAVADEDGTGSMTDCMGKICGILLESNVSEDIVSNLAHALLWLDYRMDTEDFDSAYYLWCLCRDYITTPGLSEAVARSCAALIPKLEAMCPDARAENVGPAWEKFEQSMLPAIKTSMEGRSFCYSESKHFCNTMHELEPLDLIAAFQGANCLYVLRPVGERFRLIGDAYVAGWMFSEAYEGLNYEEVDYDIEII